MQRIMIVEDEAIAALFLRSTLQHLGHQVTAEVDNGVSAVERAHEDRPDVVFMDIRLRGDMDGVEAANHIRQQTGIRSIFVSAYDADSIRRRYCRPEEFKLLSKPVSVQDLNQALKEICKLVA